VSRLLICQTFNDVLRVQVSFLLPLFGSLADRLFWEQD
jgi:hypothetical protein